MKVREVDWRNVSQSGPVSEKEKLEEWCSKRCDGSPLKIIEVGSLWGASTCLLAQFGTVISIDPYVNGPTSPESFTNYHAEGILLIMLGALRRFGLVNVIHPIISTSQVLSCMDPLGADIVYIDGSHKHKDVKNDISNVRRHIKPNGLWIFHDYKRPGPRQGPYSGVAVAVDEFLEDGDWEIKEHFGGIVCLRRKS